MTISPDFPTGVETDALTMRWASSCADGFLTFTPAGLFDPEALLPAVREAIAAANAGDDPIAVSMIVEGTNALHLRLHHDAARRLRVLVSVTNLAHALTAAGLKGTLRQQIPQHPPEWVTSGSLYARAVSVNYAARGTTDAHFTQRLAAAYGLDALANHLLSGGGEFSFAVPYTSQTLAVMPMMQRGVYLTGWDREPHEHAEIGVAPSFAWGSTHLGDRPTQVDRARAALQSLAVDVSHAFATVPTGLGGGWGAGHHSPPDGIDSGTYVQSRWLWPERVFDAHGLQVLTAEHLDRATDLTDWHTTQIGDRYLVEARHLDAWFADDGPDPDALAAARADFGELIITEAEHVARRIARHEARTKADSPTR